MYREIDSIIRDASFIAYKVFDDFFLYDDVKGEVVKITKELYNCLSDTLSNELTFTQTEEINNLISRGYLQKKSMLEKCHPYFEDYESILSRKLHKMVLQVTQQCNLRCKYCPYSQDGKIERTHKNEFMSFEVAKAAVDFLYTRSIDCDNIVIEFYGGEPLLNIKLIEDVIIYTKSIFRDRRLSFNIITNGTLLEKDMFDFFIKHDISLYISFDGIKKINDTNRVFGINIGASVYDCLIKNLKAIYNYNKDYFMDKVAISMVVDPAFPLSDYEKIYEEEDFLKSIKIKANIKNDSFLEIKNNISDAYLIESERNKATRLFAALKGFKVDYEVININTSSRINDIIKYFDESPIDAGKTLPGGQCIPGHPKLFIDINGNILPCEKVSENNKNNIIGNVYTGFENKKIEDILLFSKDNHTNCSKCFAYSGCTLCVSHKPYLTSIDGGFGEPCRSTRQIQFEKIYVKTIVNQIHTNMFKNAINELEGLK